MQIIASPEDQKVTFFEPFFSLAFVLPSRSWRRSGSPLLRKDKPPLCKDRPPLRKDTLASTGRQALAGKIANINQNLR